MGKLIAIEGVDASGKQTQATLLYEYLKKTGKKVRKIEFPCYDRDSSSLVKMYLKGEFGENAENISPYIASTFFAADRYASYMTDWKKDYLDPDIIILADRYVTANMIHQASKISDLDQKDAFLKWLSDFEYGLYGLPKPDLVLFLHMPLFKIQEILKIRENKIDGSEKKDIHEANQHYLQKTYENALYIARKEGFYFIDADDGNGSIKSIETVAGEIQNAVGKML